MTVSDEEKTGVLDSEGEMEDEAARLAAYLSACRRAVIFTGAGISTESGIPDFRSPGGLWTRRQPILFDDFVASEEARRDSWNLRFEGDDMLRSAQPNRGHRAVAELVAQGVVKTVITQNIDGLHQQSGVADTDIVELHGSTMYARCLDCRERHELEPIRARFVADGTLPECGACGGLVKTATISFGQAMPEVEMARAAEATRDCDLFIVLGSSLTVQPAAGFPILAKECSARLVIVNREATPLDPIADLVARGGIGAVLGGAVGVS